MAAQWGITLATAGVVVIPGVLSPEELSYGRNRLDQICASAANPDLDAPGYSVDTGAAGEQLVSGVPGARFATNLLSKDPFFVGLIERPPVIDLVRSLIPDPLLSALNLLEPLQGSGNQSLHRDEGPVGAAGIVTVNSLWVFDDMDADNGATRYVPGTHLSGELTGDGDPRIQYACCPAGSVIVMNAHLLHAASVNRDGRRRRVVHIYFTKQGRRPQTDWARYVPAATRSSLSDSTRQLVGL